MSTSLKQYVVSMTAVAALLLAGCAPSVSKPAATSEHQTTTEKPAAPPQIVAAKTAFFPMYTAARAWSPDVVVLRITAKEVPGFKNADGKAAMWEAAFASATKREYRVYTYAIAAVPPEIHKGVAAGLSMPWSGPTRDAMPVDVTLFNIDSDEAYKAASADAAAWLKTNAGKDLTSFEIGDTSKFQGPVWYVMWGNKKGGYVTFIDANTGKVLKRS
jgi:hypothetical protein